MERLCALILEFDSRYAAAKLERRKLDFGDMEHDALALLARPDGTPTALAAELGSRYAEIMLDEYQDTNALQERIFAALTAGGCHRFMVGDVKQSIYGFREACPENFLEKRESYAPAEEAALPGKDRPKRQLPHPAGDHRLYQPAVQPHYDPKNGGNGLPAGG